MSHQDTIEITNDKFVLAIIGNRLAAGECLWGCSFSQDPGNAGGREWKGRSLSLESAQEGLNGVHPPGTYVNTYFSLSTFKKASGTRGLGNAAACFALILDDVGTKAEEAQLPEPTWKIETSPGNYQYGYAFAEPITRMKDAQTLFKALARRRRISDPGGQSPVRYARLPNGFNTKAKYRREDGSCPPTRLVHWRPELRYRPEALAAALGLELTDSPRRSSPPGGGPEAASPENPVLIRLREAGLYKSEKDPGKHEITCPWVSEHTDQADNGTAYFEPSEEYPHGGFKCHHGHCAHRGVHDLHQHLGVESADTRPIIRVKGGDLHQIVDKCEALLHADGYYQNAGTIISIRKHRTPQGEILSTVPLDPVAATLEFTRLAQWKRLDSRSRSWVNIDAPPKHAQALINAPQRQHLRPLVAMSRQPFLRTDGSVCLSGGYDPASQIYADFDPTQFPAIPEQPTREDAVRSLALLAGLVVEVCFKTPVDQSAALALFLSAAVRSSLPTCPGFLINAHASGSGKSYLQDLAGVFATAESPLPAAAFMANEEEFRKELLSKLLGTPAVIKFDEMKSDLDPVRALLSALTSELIEGRRLGYSQILKVSTRTLMLFAGNNVAPVGDMARRIVSIHLDPAMENPATREFTRDPLTELRQHRGLYIMAALTVIRAWLAAGQPKAPHAKITVNGYPQWSDWCRQPLLWLGYPDPATSLFEALKSDPDKEALQQVMETWEAAFAGSVVSARQAVAKAESDEPFRDALLEVAEGRSGEIDPKKLGYYLKRHQGQRILGRFFELDRSAVCNSNRYVLRYVDSRPPITSHPAPVSPDPMLPSLTLSSPVALGSDSSDSSDSSDAGAGSEGATPAVAEEALAGRPPCPGDQDWGESSRLAERLPSIEAFEV